MVDSIPAVSQFIYECKIMQVWNIIKIGSHLQKLF